MSSRLPQGGETAEEYIAKQKPELQAILKKLRSLVKKSAPGLEEKIKWGMPWYVDGKENVCVLMAAGSWVDLGSTVEPS